MAVSLVSKKALLGDVGSVGTRDIGNLKGCQTRSGYDTGYSTRYQEGNDLTEKNDLTSLEVHWNSYHIMSTHKTSEKFTLRLTE